MFVRTVYEDHYQHILKRASDAEAALPTAQAEIEKLRGELDVLSSSHRDLASRLAKEGEARKATEAQAEEMRRALDEKIVFWRDQEREWSKSKKDPTSIMVAAQARAKAEVLEELRTALSLMKGGESK